MANRSHCEFSIRITTLEMDNDDYGVREISTFDVHHSEINYRAEGNANIVLALPLRCQVLRLAKSKSRRISSDHGLQLPKTFYVYKYIKSVSSLFGTQFSSPPTLVRVQFTNERNFEEWLNDLRPSERKSSSFNDLCFDYGLLYSDAAFLNKPQSTECTTFAVEIKPKQGWHIRQLPDNVLKLFGVERDAIDKCRFCSMQFSKAIDGKIARVGDFCPLDLFSGDLPRMNKALRCLAESPQNNFRIFRNGRPVYAEGSHISDFERITSEIFLADDGQSERDTSDEFFMLLCRVLLGSESNTAMETPTLPNDCILNRILNLQRLALETMPSIARKYSNESPLFDVDALTRDVNWPFEHLNELSRKIDTYASSKFEIDKPFLESALKLTQDELYEIGATALDCSIMLTFQRQRKHIDTNYPGHMHIITVDGVDFIAKSAVFDLDPKLYPTHFPKYIDRTKRSYDAWTQSLSNK